MVKEYMHRANVLWEAKGVGPTFTVLVGFEDLSLPALLARANIAIRRNLSNIVPELFVGLVRAFENGLAKATELRTGASSPSWRFTS